MEDNPTPTPTREKQVELTFIPWLAKINERITLFLKGIKDMQPNMPESDYEIIEEQHRLWFNGNIILYQTITIPDRHKAIDQSLFPDTLAEETTIDPIGTVIDSIPSEPLISK